MLNYLIVRFSTWCSQQDLIQVCELYVYKFNKYWVKLFVPVTTVNHYETATTILSNFISCIQKFCWCNIWYNNINVRYIRKSMNLLTCYTELYPKLFSINWSLIENFITSVLTIKDTWHLWQITKLLKKGNHYTYYHNTLKYVSHFW